MLKQTGRVFIALSFVFFSNFLWAAKAVDFTPPDFVPDQVVSDDKIIYLLSKTNKAIYRWSISSSSYLSPVTVGLFKDNVEHMPTTIEVAPGHSRLYLGYETGDIRYLTLSGTATERSFATTAMPIKQLAAAGKFLIVIDGTSDYVGNRYSFNNRGNIVFQDSSQQYLRYRHLWSSVDSKVYLSDITQFTFTTIDQRTGKISTEANQFSYSSHYSGFNAISGISADGRFLLTRDGQIADSRKLNQAATRINNGLTVGKFLPDGKIVSVSLNGFSWPLKSTLTMRDINLRVLEQLEYEGELLRIYGNPTKYAVLIIQNNKLVVHTYIPNPDSDSDGVANTLDAFPLDAAASRDSDKDGFPDAWNRNQNASNSPTNLVLDAYPKDAECNSLAQGDGKICNYASIIGAFTPDAVASDGKTVYLLNISKQKIYRWSLEKNTFISPLKPGITSDYQQLFPTTLVFSPEDNRLYLGYANGAINYLLTTGSTAEKPFANTQTGVWALASAGKMLVVQDDNYRYVFDSKGVQKDKKQEYRQALKFTWDKINSRLYFVGVGYNNYAFNYLSVNQVTGKLSEVISSVSNYSRPLRNLLVIAPDASKILLGNGDIFNAKDLAFSHTHGRILDGVRWLADGSIVQIVNTGNNFTISRVDLTGRPLESISFNAQFQIGLFGADKSLFALGTKDGNWVSVNFIPRDDIDGDKVPNTLDAFPNDPAASIDSDNDGYPDAWNKGYNQSKSTTGLVLDAYPQDSACGLITDGNGTICDYAAKIPAFIPDQIINEGDIIYLLSKANSRIYRWSLDAGNFINPLIVGVREGGNTLTPTSFAVSTDHQRIYTGYANGQVNSISLGSYKENHFVTNAAGIQQLIAVGKYLHISTSSNNFGAGTLSIFDKQGLATFSGRTSYLSGTFEWSSTNSKLYYFRDNASPNDLLFRVIDQTNGRIVEEGETPYHGAYSIQGPIRASADGRLVLLGSGDLYESTQLNWAGSLGARIVDAKWRDDNSLITIQVENNQTKLQWRNAALKTLEEKRFNGLGLGIFGSDNSMQVLVLDEQGKLKTYPYMPSNDTDADGVNNTDDAFPSDPAASLDTDNDGYPDLWNLDKSASDSTSGLTLDSYPLDSACYLPEHGDGTNCDYAATMPDFIPDQIVSDGNVIYYLSKINSRIYRWSIADKNFINPWIIGIAKGFTTVAPDKIALSQSQGRMYLGYETGQVRYINLKGNKEYDFAAVAMSVNGMAAVGDYLMVQDSSGAWATHYIFNADGTLTDSKDWNYYSPEYTWDPINSKIYFFSSFSPADLNFEIVDQTNGKITQEGETPYHGAYNTSGVIRVSADGTRVLLGSGDIYNGSDLTWATSVGAATDARWLADNSLVTVKNSSGEIVVERRNANMQVVEQRVFAGEALGIFGSDTEMTLAAFIDGELSAYTYVPSDDSDNDGVANTLDVFPLDPAASVDTDHDGYPDSWNPGYTQADSTTHLTLDAYPQDAACYLPAHGNGSDCDFGATIPNYTPDQIASDSNYIYLLSKANKRIYRWSLAERKYVDPFVIGYQQGITSHVPTKMALSEAHQRIYLGYESGAIRYLDLQAGQESAFASIAMAVNGLVSVGEYLLAQDFSGAWATHYIIDEFGTITDSKEWNHSSPDYAWSPVDSKLYYFSQWSPADLNFETVDQLSGKIVNQGETPYHGNYVIRPPIRVSPDASQVILGSGDIYRSTDLTFQSSLGHFIEDAMWFAGGLLTLENNQLKLFNSVDYTELQSFAVPGTALRIVATGQNVEVVHSVNGGVQFTQYAIGDNDGDGLPKWWENANGLNDDYAGDAVLDSDGDLLTNLEEYQVKTNPNIVDSDTDGISDGNEVKTYLSNPTKTDTDADGLNDFEEVFTHQTDPVKSDTDEDSFSDYLEVIVYNTNPNSTTSIPPAITGMQESFEAPNVSPLWVAGTDSNANWTIDTTSTFEGANSIRSGVIGHSERSSVVYKGLFAAGTLSFYARVDAEGCCDYLSVYVDGEWRLSVASYNGSWAQYSVVLTTGMHEIEWRYQKDSSAISGADAAWIDQVEFTSN